MLETAAGTTTATTLPLWASIVIAVVPLVISLVALVGGWKQQSASRRQQAAEHTANLGQQKTQLTETLQHDSTQQAQTLEHQRRQEDLREARSVLDDAARALQQADHRRRALYQDLDNTKKRKALRVVAVVLDEIIARLKVRFGREHVVTVTFSDCTEAVFEAFKAAQGGLDVTLSQRTTQFNAAGVDFETHWAAFSDAANAYAGIELTPATA
jgi:hypothetical protein